MTRTLTTMTLRPFMLTTACAFLALTAACGDGDRGVRITSTTTVDDDAKGVLKVVDTLQCPQTMGSLTRKGSATDGGRVCNYTGPKGAEVTLHLVPLGEDTPAQVLKAFESRLSVELPQAVAEMRAQAAEADRDKAETDRAAAEADRAAAEADRASGSGDRASVRAPGVDIQADGDDASVRLPGMRIETKGDQASVRIGGFHIDANDSDASVQVNGSDSGDNVSIQANDGSAEVRAVSGGDATRASWILTNTQPSPAGWRLVGYEARGPRGGPLVVATVRSKDHNRGRVFEDAKDLVALNVGE